MSIVCKLPEPLSFTRNVAQNWQKFVEQLQWFLEGTESTEKGDKVKIGLMLFHAVKEAREIYKTLLWASTGDADKFDKVFEAFWNYCLARKNIIYKDTHFGAFSKKKVNQSTRI